MRENKDNHVYIEHILDAIKNIIDYTTSHTPAQFYENEWDQAASIRNLEIIGEAVTRIDKEFKESHPEIDWRDMVDFRNVLIHDYLDVDIKIVWTVMTTDVPQLKDKLLELLKGN